MANRTKPKSFDVITGGKTADYPDMPDWLSELAIVEWENLKKQLKSAHFISKQDQTALAILSELMAEFKVCPQDFMTAKLTQMRLLMGDFGLTPHSRAKLPEAKKGKSNPFGEI